MRILLIKPPLNRNLFTPSCGEPLELEYLASAVKEHEVEILDMRIDKNLDLKLERFNPHLVGVTSYTCDANAAKDVLKEVKKHRSGIINAIGGHHATFLPAYFAAPFIDVVFLGMSDISFKEYVNTVENGGDPRSVKNIAIRTDESLLFTERTHFDVNLDSLPFPARHLTDLYRKYYRDHMRYRTVYMMTSRGCPFRCTFCACWNLMEGKYIVRSPESIVEEIAGLPEDVDLVNFSDDNTLHGIGRAWRLSNLIRERKMRRKFSMFARADTIVKHPDLIKNFKEIGLQYLTVGIEAIKDEDLDNLNKRVTVQTNNEAIRILQRLGISNAAHFIVCPDYTKEDFEELFNYVCRLNLFHPLFTVLTPLPGTELYRKTHDQLVIRDYDFFDFVHSVLPTKLSRREFYHQFARLYLRCYSFKRYFKSILKDIRLRLKKTKDAVHYHPDRLPFLRMVFLHLGGIPLYWRHRNIYKSEPLFEP